MVGATDRPAEAGAHVLVLASLKGGVGRTTLAAHLAVASGGALIDADASGGLAAWHGARADTDAAALDLFSGPDPDAVDRAIAAGHGLVVVDTDGDEDRLAALLARASLVLVPVGASPHDLFLLQPMIERIEAAGRPFAMVLNGAMPKAKINDEAMLALCQFGSVAPGMVQRRAEFATAMMDGGTVIEARAKGPAAAEVRALADYLAKRLDGLARIPPPALPAPQAPRPADRRRYPRFACALEATVAEDGAGRPCRINDISASGARIAGRDLPPLGNVVLLSQPGIGDARGRIVRTGDGEAALTFLDKGEARWLRVKRLAALAEAPGALSLRAA